MGRKPNADTIRLIAGVTLKRHPRTAIWQLSCSAHSQTIRKSLMTTDETAARLAALDYYQAQREHIRLGKSVNRVSFPEAAIAYLQTVIGKSKRDYHAETIDRHLLPYFENFKVIRQVTAGKVSDYLVHRRTKNAREPEPQTLNRENSVLRQLLEYAAIQAWLPEKITVSVKSTRLLAHLGVSTRRGDLQGQAVEGALRRSDHIGRDAGIERGRHQAVVAKQDLDDTDVGSGLQQVRRETVAQGMQRQGMSSGMLVRPSVTP